VRTLAIRRVVVLGHDGFIGRHVLEVFRRRSPAIEVVGRSLPEADLTQPEQAMSLRAYCDDATAFIICAGVKRQLGDTLDALERNLQMAINLGRLFAERPPRRVIFFSSAAVYGEQLAHTALTERTPVKPTSLYGVAKYASELTLAQVLENGSAECAFAALRPPLVYGPGDRSHGYGPAAFVRAAVRREPIEVWGNGTERRGFTFVEDVAELVWQLTDKDISGPLNVIDGQSASFEDILAMLSPLAPQPLQLRSRPRTKPAVDHLYAHGRIRELLPTFMFTPLETGLKRTYEAAVQAMEQRA
jgi:UDP-glucose 4-epimerase